MQTDNFKFANLPFERGEILSQAEIQEDELIGDIPEAAKHSIDDSSGKSDMSGFFSGTLGGRKDENGYY